MSGQSAQCSVRNTGKKLFLLFRWDFLGITFHVLPVLLLGTTEQNLTPSPQILADNDGVPVVSRADSGTLDWKLSHLQKLCPSHRIQILNSAAVGLLKCSGFLLCAHGAQPLPHIPGESAHTLRFLECSLPSPPATRGRVGQAGAGECACNILTASAVTWRAEGHKPEEATGSVPCHQNSAHGGLFGHWAR